MPFMKNRSVTQIVSEHDVAVFTDKLQPGFYQVNYSMEKGFLLCDTHGWKLPKKIYGDVGNRVERIMRTFDDRPHGTGVLLSGEKGSGKTLLAKLLALKGIERKMPVIIVTAPYHGDGFNRFIQSIDQPAIVIFDEFEKVYSPEDQEDMLTLLDGVYPTKKLFILTCNDQDLNVNMINRPGRIFYHFSYGGVDEKFIRDYCDDNLAEKEKTESIIASTILFNAFNFDMLKAVVEEVNRYGESPKEALGYLNMTPDSDSGYYEVKIEHKKGKAIAEFSPPTWSGNPFEAFHMRAGIHYTSVEEKQKKAKKDDRVNYDEIWSFIPDHLVKIDANKKRLIFTNSEGHTMSLTKKIYYKRPPLDYLD